MCITDSTCIGNRALSCYNCHLGAARARINGLGRLKNWVFDLDAISTSDYRCLSKNKF